MTKPNSTHMELAVMSRDELRKVAAELNIAGRGKMLKPELVEAIATERASRIKANVNQPRGIVNSGETTTIMDHMEALNASRDVHALEQVRTQPTIKPQTRKLRKAARRKPERGMIRTEADGSEIMPLHYRGRAMGAKHLPSPWGRPGEPKESGQARPVGYDRRELAYVAQSGYRREFALTPKQERRLRHKANHHNAVMADPR